MTQPLLPVLSLSLQCTRPTRTITAVRCRTTSPSLTLGTTPAPPPLLTLAVTPVSAVSPSRWSAATGGRRCRPATAARTWTTSWAPMGCHCRAHSARPSSPPSATTRRQRRPAAWTTCRPATTRGLVCASAWPRHPMPSGQGRHRCHRHRRCRQPTAHSLRHAPWWGPTTAASTAPASWRATTVAVKRSCFRGDRKKKRKILLIFFLFFLEMKAATFGTSSLLLLHHLLCLTVQVKLSSAPVHLLVSATHYLVSGFWRISNDFLESRKKGAQLRPLWGFFGGGKSLEAIRPTKPSSLVCVYATTNRLAGGKEWCKSPDKQSNKQTFPVHQSGWSGLLEGKQSLAAFWFCCFLLTPTRAGSSLGVWEFGGAQRDVTVMNNNKKKIHCWWIRCVSVFLLCWQFISVNSQRCESSMQRFNGDTDVSFFFSNGKCSSGTFQ